MSLAIIILNWNGKSDTLACLSSLPRDSWIIVVDNGSTDDSVEVIGEQFPHVEIVQTGKNLGYAGGNNHGIKYALGKGADLILLLNNDTVVDPHFVTAFLKAAQDSPHIGIFGGYPLRFDTPTQLDHLGGIWDEKKGVFTLVGLGAPDGFSTQAPLDYVTGCSILIRKEVFQTIGLLEEKFFLFWEEADFCKRAKKAAFELTICYEARLLHKVSASFIGGSPHKTYFWWRGRGLWIERNCSLDEQKHLFKTILLPEIVHLLKLRCIKGLELAFLKLLCQKNLSQKESKLLQYRSALAGYFDYHHQRFGSGPSWLFKK